MKKIYFVFAFICISHFNLYSQWSWQNPLPQGNHLRDVFFINSSIGWAVGDFGTILKTTDGGENWFLQNRVTHLSLTSIHFINENMGLAVGDSGIVLKTNDGGNNWFVANQVLGSRVNLKCVLLSSTFGYLIIRDYLGNSSLFKTLNGGINWHYATYSIEQIQASQAGIWASTNNNMLQRIFPVMVDTLADSTKSYFITNNPFTPHHIYFFDGVHGWFISTDLIYRTNNAWLNWTSIQSTLPFDPKTIYFSDISNGMVFCITGKIFKTTNGGETFTELPHQFLEFRLKAISFKNASEWVAVGENGLIAKTTNGGISWREISSRIYTKGDYRRELNSVYFPDQNTGFTVGSYGTILKTTNSGLTWFDISIPDSGNLKSTFFVSKDTGWAVGSKEPHATAGRIYKTTNGGSTWNENFLGGYDSWNNCIFFVNSNLGFVGSKKGIIWKTTNSGISWSKKRQDNYQSVSSLHFPSSNIGWAISSVPLSVTYLLKTTNGGESWINKNAFSYLSVYDVFFIDTTTGWLVGNDIYKTTDAGETWVKKAEIGYSLNSVYFRDRHNGYAVGSQGKIYRTSDGGDTWTEEFITDLSLASVFYNKDTWWIAGDYMMLLKNYDPSVSVDDKAGTIISGFKLEQNYPNPFNPSTVISFQLAVGSQVSLKVFDVLGREVETLLDEELEAGTYERKWNASHLPSGVYYYQLKAGSFVETKKLILLK